MTNIILDDGPGRRGEPPRLGVVVAIGAVLVVGAIVLFGGAGREQRADTFDLAATTSPSTTTAATTAPTTTTTVTAASSATIEHDQAELIGGRLHINWLEEDLPEGLTAVFLVGLHRGHVAVIGSYADPGATGAPPGGYLVVQNDDGSWGTPVEIFGTDETYTAAAIHDRGYLVASAAGPLWSYFSGSSTVYGSVDGESWQATALGDELTGVFVESIAIDAQAAWLSVSEATRPYAPLVATLPATVQGLLSSPHAELVVDGDAVTVWALGSEVWRSSAADLGAAMPTGSAMFRRGLLASPDLLTVTQVPVDANVFRSALASADGRGIVALNFDTGSVTVEESVDGATWRPVTELTAVPDVWSVHRLRDDIFVRTYASRPELIHYTPDRPLADGGSRRHLFNLDSTFSASPAIGGAGLFLPLSDVEYPDPGSLAFERDGVGVTMDGAGLVEVTRDAETFRYRLYSGANAMTFDEASGLIDLLDGDGTPVISLSVAELTMGISQTPRPVVKSTSVLYTPDGERWGWEVVLDLTGTAPGEITGAAVGDDRVYVVTGKAVHWYSIDPAALAPRLFVGTPSG